MAMNISIKLDGAEQVLANIRTAAQAVRHEVTSELYLQGEYVMTDSKEHYVPVDEAVLKDSGHVQPPVIEDQKILVRLVYGGLAKAYAIIQHERLDFKHRVGGPKYLERPALAAAGRIIAALGEAVRRGLAQ